MSHLAHAAAAAAALAAPSTAAAAALPLEPHRSSAARLGERDGEEGGLLNDVGADVARDVGAPVSCDSIGTTAAGADRSWNFCPSMVMIDVGSASGNGR